MIMPTLKTILDFLESDLKKLDKTNAFDSLRLLLKELKKIKSSSDNIKIYDYFEDCYFEVDSQEAQLTADKFYEDYFVNFFLNKFEWLSKFVKDFKLNSGFDDAVVFNFMRCFLFTLKKNVELLDNSICYNTFKFEFCRNLTFFFTTDSKVLALNANELLKHLVDEKYIFLIPNNRFIFKEDSIRLYLLVISLSFIQIEKENEFSIKYNCHYNLVNLYPIIVKYLTNTNTDYNNYLLEKYSAITETNIDKYFVLQNNLESFLNDDFSKFYCFAADPKDYFLLCHIYVNKLILKEFCFQSVLMSCFEFYYFDIRRNNILYDKSGQFIFNLTN